MPSDLAVSSKVLIVGAGPVGCTTAAALADAGFTDITVADRRTDPTVFEWERAYSLVLHQSGQKLLRSLPGLGEVVKHEAVSQHVRVDAVISPDGAVSMSSRRPPAGPVYWLLKTRMLQVLDEYVRSRYPTVRFITGASVTEVQLPTPPPAGTLPSRRTQVTLSRATDGTEQQLEVDLLIACDGSNSSVRTMFSKLGSQVDSKYGTGVYSQPSPSTGLRHKGVVLDSRPIISPPGAPVQYAEASVTYTLRGARVGRNPSTVFDMLVLPVSGQAGVSRRGAITVSPGHALLEVKDTDEALQLFRDNFPQLRVDDFVSREEMDKFVMIRASEFPPITRPYSLVARFRHAPRQGGVLFIGDAAHAFPPDAAQGINSAMQDVDALLGVARSITASRASVHDLLSAYEKARHAETWALMELAAVAAPYQYGQNRLGAARAAASKSLRGALAAVAPGIVWPHVDKLIRQGLTYDAVRRRNRRSLAAIRVLGAALLLAPLAVAAAARRSSMEVEE
ncbi:hypothetical protein MMPV_008860 [Pyropia vietnamensis]